MNSFAASKSTLNDSKFSNNLAGGVFSIQAGSLQLQFTPDHASVGGGFTNNRAPNLSLKIKITNLLAQATSDVEGDTVRTATGQLVITAEAPQGRNANAVAFSTPGIPTMTFAGLPGHSYDVQRTTNLTPPVTWTTLHTTNAPPLGLFNFVDGNPPTSLAYYRTVQHAVLKIGDKDHAMNGKILLLSAGLLLGATAQGALLTINSGTLNAAIPDGNVNGYQSTLTFNDSNFNNVLDVDVKLNISGGYNGDLYVYLTHSSGFSVLLNRAGRTSGNAFGYADAGFNVTFNDAASTDIHNYGGNGGNQLTGSWQPDARNVDPATVTDASSRSAFLSAFNSLDPNGTWTLFAADVSSGDQSTLVSWELDITAVPEPVTVALGIFGGLFALLGAAHLWRLRRAPSGKE